MLEENSKIIDKAPVAVVIAYYNGSAWIARALTSVYNQTVSPSEVIVVNDGSASEEVIALEALQKKMKFKIVHKENGGQGSARNVGVASCEQPYICFLDQDDFFLSNHIEELYKLVSQNDRGFAYGNAKEATEEGEIVSSHLLPHVSFHDGTVRLEELLGKDLFVLPGASIVRRLDFEKVGGFDERLRGYEDDDLFLRLFVSGSEYGFTNNPVLVWCIRSNSTSYSNLMLESRWIYFNKLDQAFPTNQRRGINYIATCIMPRFEPIFLSDIFKFRILGDNSLERAIPIGELYLKAIQSRTDVPFSMVLSARIRFAILRYLPKPLLPVLRSVHAKIFSSR